VHTACFQAELENTPENHVYWQRARPSIKTAGQDLRNQGFKALFKNALIPLQGFFFTDWIIPSILEMIAYTICF
jgi:hypothetical protein